MWRFGYLALIASACSSLDGGQIAPDAGTDDASVCVDNVDYVFSELTGHAPSGPLAPLHYMSVHHLLCGGFIIELTEGRPCDEGGEGRTLTLRVRFFPDSPPTAGDVIDGYAVLSDVSDTSDSTPIAFHVVHLDSPYDVPMMPRITGRFVATATDWDLDINLDAVSQFPESCTLFR